MIKIKNCRYGPMLYLENDKWTGRSFDLYGEAYQKQIWLMESFIEEGDFVIDAGANIGAMTIPFSKKVGQTGMVLSFEPQEFLYYVLCGNVAANNLYNVTTYCEAISDISGDELFCPSARLKNKDGIPFYDDNLQHYGGVSLTEEMRFDTDCVVSTVAIDDLCLDKCNFIKMDIEGYELQGLAGAEKTIQDYKPILFLESMPWCLPKISDAVGKLGYVYRSCRIPFYNSDNFFKNGTDVLRDESSPNSPMMSSDIICYHKDYQSEMDFKYFKAVKDLI